MKKIEKYLKNLKHKLYFDFFINKEEFIMNKSEQFIDDLFKYNIFYKIVDLISLDKGFLKSHNWEISKNSRKRIIEKLENNFKEIYRECNYDLQIKIYQLLIENLDFTQYFDLNGIISTYMDYEEEYENFNLFLIFFIFKGKMRQQNFIKNLEANYGIYLDVDIFIKEINKIITEPTNFFFDSNKYFGEVFMKNLRDIVFLHNFKKMKIIKQLKIERKRTTNIFSNHSLSLKNFFNRFISFLKYRKKKKLKEIIKCKENKKIIKNPIRIFNKTNKKRINDFKNNNNRYITILNNKINNRKGFKKDYR